MRPRDGWRSRAVNQKRAPVPHDPRAERFVQADRFGNGGFHGGLRSIAIISCQGPVIIRPALSKPAARAAWQRDDRCAWTAFGARFLL